MGAKLIDWGLLNIEDKNGIVRPLKGCALSQLEELETTVKTIWSSIAEHPEVPIVSIIHTSESIRNLHIKALQLCNINPDWIDVDMMTQLLYNYRSEAGVEHYGLLIEKNLPHLCVITPEMEQFNNELEKTWAALKEVEANLEKLAGVEDGSRDSI